MLQVKQWCNDLIGLLFPNLCNACGVALYHSEYLICTKCLYDLPFTDYHEYADNRVARQFWGRLPINAAMAMLYFRKGTKVQNLIHNLKYNGRTDVGILLGNMLGERLRTATLYQDIDLVIPVPLHRKKYKMRGYNQSMFIAEGIAAQMGTGISGDHLIRNTYTESQTKKSRYNRYENMKDVFQVNFQEDIMGKHVLLVDDVITTGATLEACADALFAAEAGKVSIAALAFAE